MNTTLFSEIEQRASQLSQDELLLIATLERKARRGFNEQQQREVAEMARDPEIQREVEAINAEFAVAEVDGLA